MTKNIFISIIAVAVLCLFAMKVSSMKYNSTGDRLYSKEDCIEDLHQIADQIRNTHPAPFDYINENDFDLLLQSQIEQLDEENSLRGFHWNARKLIASIGCGHTALNGKNEERKISDSLHFPLSTRFVGDQLYIVHNDERYPSLLSGTEIISINGQSTKAILDSTIKRVSSDGLNDAYPRFYINREVGFFIESHFQIPDIYTLVLANNTSIEIAAGIAHSLSVDNRHLQTEKLFFDLDKNNDLSIMTIRSFVYYSQDYNQFESFVDNSMDQLREHKINNLIIDIRGNGGGDPNCANHLLRYISKSSYQYFHENNMGYPDLKREISPYDNAFQGQTYMIIDGGCGSTSGHLSSLVKYNKTATLVGQTSGATFKCHDNSGNVTLSNTQLNLHIARNTFQTAVVGMTVSEGVVPDIVIPKTVDDWTTSGDSVVDSIYQIIRR